MMNSARLIDLVYARDPLWNPKSGYYHNREMKHLLWTEIAAELGLSRETVRTKWSCLRDSFRRELKKRNDSGLSNKAQWPFFERMLFLTSAMSSKDWHDQEYYGDNGEAFEVMANPEVLLTGSCVEEAPSTTERPDVTVKQEEPSTSTPMPHHPPQTTYHPPPITSMMPDFPKQRCPQLTPLQQQLDSTKDRTKLKKIRKKLKKDKKRDEDYHFALSLVSSMRKVPDHQKFKMRMMVMETIGSFISHTPDNPDQSTCDNSTVNEAESYTETDLSHSQNDGTQGLFSIGKNESME